MFQNIAWALLGFLVDRWMGTIKLNVFFEYISKRTERKKLFEA
jgi:hypothetical protein